MPIPIDRLKAAQAPLADRVFDFLATHAGQAYMAAELYVALEGYDDNTGQIMIAMLTQTQRRTALDPLIVELQKLEKAGKIVSAQQRGVTYYAINKAEG